MSQLGHYVNRRNVQAAVSQVWPIFFGGRKLICRMSSPASRITPSTGLKSSFLGTLNW